MQAGLLGNVLL